MFQSFYKQLVLGAAFMLMPDWSAGAGVQTKTATIEWLATGGDRAATQIDGLNSGVLDATLPGVRAALAAMSNAVPIAQTMSNKAQAQLGVDAPYDEAYSEASSKMILQFQNATLDTRRISIPAPDAQFFSADGVTVIAPDNAATAGSAPELLGNAVGLLLAMLNVGGGTYAYIGGYRSIRSRSLPRGRTVVQPIEPVADEPPGDEPGLIVAP